MNSYPKNRKQTKTSHHYHLILIACLLIISALWIPYKATASVKATIQNCGNNCYKIKIHTFGPKPGTLIIEEQLASGTVLKNANPSPVSYSSSRGIAKWVLSGRRNHTITIHLGGHGAPPYGYVRFRDRRGKLNSIPIINR